MSQVVSTISGLAVSNAARVFAAAQFITPGSWYVLYPHASKQIAFENYLQSMMTAQLLTIFGRGTKAVTVIVEKGSSHGQLTRTLWGHLLWCTEYVQLLSEEAPVRHRGKIIAWNKDELFGFIRPLHQGEDVFISSARLPTFLETAPRALLIGTEVAYDHLTPPPQHTGKLRAQHVKAVSLPLSLAAYYKGKPPFPGGFEAMAYYELFLIKAGLMLESTVSVLVHDELRRRIGYVCRTPVLPPISERFLRPLFQGDLVKIGEKTYRVVTISTGLGIVVEREPVTTPAQPDLVGETP